MRTLLAAALLPGLIALGLRAQTSQGIYADALQNGWQNYGWTLIDYAATNVVHGGTKSISITLTQSFQAIYLHHTAQDASPYTNLTLWVHGGASGGQQVRLQALLNGSALPGMNLAAFPANAWTQINVPLAALGVSNQTTFDGFWFQDRIGAAQPVFYLDDVALTGPPPPPPVPLSIVVNVSSNRHAISDFIYGVAFASSNELKDLNAPLNRSGGNTETRYNWAINAHNRANDFYFESIGDSPSTAGAAADNHVQLSRNGGAEPMLTVSMIDWMPKLGAGRAKLASYNTNKYGVQTGNDAQYFPAAGNGVLATNVTNTIDITWNDPNDANFLTNSAHQNAWVQHLTNRWRWATNGGVRYYLMDNEHSLWQSTHRDVHPVGPSMREIRDKFFEHASMVKSNDANALVFAPEEWGWSGYFWSGYDQQWSGQRKDYDQSHYPDRGTNGGWDYLPWFLDQVRQRATNTNQRLLDYFTVHFYPQGGESGSSVSPDIQALRNRSTRALWDTNYTDASWINAKVKLIPRLKEWVATYYPGTKIGITEYNWGAENHMNGATAQADILGIFGREGLDLATRWTTPTNSAPAYKAMKLFRNYDNNKSTFGQTSVWASVPNPDIVSAFGAQRTNDGALTLLVVNKTNVVTNAVLVLSNFLHAGTAQVWALETNAITRRADATFAGNNFTSALPAQSAVLFVLAPGSPPRLRAEATSGPGIFNATLLAPAGQRYVIEANTNLAGMNWAGAWTNTVATNATPVALPANSGQRFFRAKWLP